MIEYKLLNNKTGVIITRHPSIVYGELSIRVTGAPTDATAIIDTANGISIYKKLIADECKIVPRSDWGTIKVTVGVLDSATPILKWVCEELKIEALRDGGILISPNDFNLPQSVTNLRIENHNLREENAQIRERLAKIEKRLVEIMEAYDFT